MSAAGALQRARPVVRGVALLLHIPALMALATLPLAAAFGELRGLWVLGITAGASLAVGQALFWPCRDAVDARRHHAMLIAALAWLAVSAFGALPFVLGAPGQLSLWINALFESLSGFTGTGMTMAADPAALPHYLQFWRSLSQWIGGLGVIVLLLSVLPVNRSALQLYYSEGRDQKILPSARSTVTAMWRLYAGLTLGGIVLLWLAGEPPWVALNHGMTAIATGGFTVTSDSLAGETALVKLAYVPIMILGGISFAVHYRVFRHGELRALFSGVEIRWLWCLLVGGALLLVLENAIHGGSVPAVDSVLQWVSAATTTGVQSAKLRAWPVVSLLLMSIIMFAGAMAGSTAGGLKTARLVLLYKSFSWGLKAVARRPHQVLRFVFDGEAITSQDAQERLRAATVLAIAWSLLTVLGVLALSHFVAPDTALQYIAFDAISAQSGVGLTSGVATPELPAGGKAVLMLLMWMGRLEIVPVMVLLALALEQATKRHHPGR